VEVIVVKGDGPEIEESEPALPTVFGMVPVAAPPAPTVIVNTLPAVIPDVTPEAAL
jgi:hypothetical protein